MKQVEVGTGHHSDTHYSDKHNSDTHHSDTHRDPTLTIPTCTCVTNPNPNPNLNPNPTCAHVDLGAGLLQYADNRPTIITLVGMVAVGMVPAPR